MIIETRAQLLTAESKPYSINGNEGISHKARFMVNGEIYELKCNAEQVTQLKYDLPSQGDLKFDLQSRKERISLVFVEFLT